MEVGTEISQKIRSAIKAKLMELGSYVDDELPDYIMVMVANKKTKQQMTDDLCLFLGTNTDVFTTWLHGLLAKLQTLSADSSKSDKSKNPKEKRKEKHSKSKEGGLGESKKEKRKASKKGDGDAPKAKSARAASLDKEENRTTHAKEISSLSVIQSEKVTDHPLDLESNLEQNNSKSVTSQEGNTKSDDIEDVRQLLVTETHGDALAEELETTEVGIEKLASSTLAVPSNITKESSVASDNENTDRDLDLDLNKNRSTSREAQAEVLAPTRKRKCPSSVVSAVRRVDDLNEDDEFTPAVASVIKVTSRRSSVPQSMQANRALLVKAMSEAERSIAAKKKIAVTKPMSREGSPSEIYTPKRRKSEAAQVSPPPYIPSRKDTSSVRSRNSAQDSERHSSAREDARILLSSRERRELISRSRRMELFQKLGIDHKESSTSNERERRVKDKHEEHSEREKDRDKMDVKNFKITAHVAPSSRLSDTAKERLAKALEQKDRSLQITLLPSSSSTEKGPLASRLGKFVVQRPSSEANKEEELSELKDRSKVTLSSKGRRRLALSLFGKEVVKKQCEAAALSVQTAGLRKYVQKEVQDSRVVESHDSSDDEEETVQEKTTVEIIESRKEEGDKYDRDSSLDKDSEDLDEMLNDNMDSDLFHDVSLTDEFTLDLDDDEDLIKAVGQLEDEDIKSVREKSESSKKEGTRFIVTLDGVDERQFEGKREEDFAGRIPPSYDPTKPSLSSQAPYVPPMPPKPVSQAPFLLPPDPSKVQPEQMTLKPAPPKIQPFSINLKDSDDEFDEKSDVKAFSKMSGFHPPVQPVIAQSSVAVAEPLSEGLTTLQKAKQMERCKFWPACAAGSECEFHHPTSYCKTFPSCKFGDKCLFIHPNCKFDSKCTRVDCPFTHTSRRPALASVPHPFQSPVPVIKQPYYPQYIPLSNSPQSTVCKFFPNCQNVNCSFIHPKPCRFGASCQNQGCLFYHPPTPGKAKLKWTAQTDQQAYQLKTALTAISVKSPPTKAAYQVTPSASSSSSSAAVSSTSV